MRPAACHFLLQYRIWHRATRPGFPSARGTRPGLGPDAMPTGLLIRRKGQVAKRVLLDSDRPSHGRDGNRTADASLFRAALYHLSYLATFGTRLEAGLRGVVHFTPIVRECRPSSYPMRKRAEHFDYSNHISFPQRSRAQRHFFQSPACIGKVPVPSFRPRSSLQIPPSCAELYPTGL